MIRLIDTTILAYTKLRTHKVRTAITVGIAGILFGVILAAVFIVQGIFDSYERFSKEGLSDRALVQISRSTRSFETYSHLEDEQFIKEVEAAHQAMVDKKTAAAKKYNVSYDAKSEDPSPVKIDKNTGKKAIDSRDMYHQSVQEVAGARTKKAFKPFDINEYLSKYPSARILKGNGAVGAMAGNSFMFMKDGKEQGLEPDPARRKLSMLARSEESPMLGTINQSVAEPFINKAIQFDPQKGEIPVVIPLNTAEKLLGFKKLSADASTEEKYNRLNEVRRNIGNVTASFCYRNAASQQLLAQATMQRDAMEEGVDTPGYVEPRLQYGLPSEASCGPVSITKDIRTAAEKKVDENRTAYEKEIGLYAGDPVQYKMTVRAVGVSGNAPGMGQESFDVSGVVYSLLSSTLGYGTWIVPMDMLQQMPEKYRPAELFQSIDSGIEDLGVFIGEGYLVEFDNLEEARSLLRASGTLTNPGEFGDVYVAPFGSSILIVEEAKDIFAKVMLWALALVGGVAVIILGSVIGRTVSEGRRESAIFRAIGARRSDIGSIYGIYALLLSIRVVLFALILGAVIALAVDIFLSQQATLAARYAYAATETNATFHFFSIASWYIPVIVGAIIVFGLIASIIPVIRSARRNPINDMRDDT